MGHEGFEKDLLGSTGVFKAQYRRLLLDEVRHTSHDGRRSSVEGVNVSLVGVWFVKNIVYIGCFAKFIVVSPFSNGKLFSLHCGPL